MTTLAGIQELGLVVLAKGDSEALNALHLAQLEGGLVGLTLGLLFLYVTRVRGAAVDEDRPHRRG